MDEPGQTWSLNEEHKLRSLKIDPIKSDPQRLEMFVRHFKTGGNLYTAVSKGIGPKHDKTVSKDLGKKIRDLTKEKLLDWVLDREKPGKEIRETELTGISVESKPIVTVKGVYKPARSVSSVIPTRTYFSHFVISNEGRGPAIELEVGLLDSGNNLLQGCRETVLMIGERITWTPDLHRPDGQYYVLCQYKTAAPDTRATYWNQTRLPFKLLEADRLGEVYVAPAQLEFKAGIKQGDKISLF